MGSFRRIDPGDRQEDRSRRSTMRDRGRDLGGPVSDALRICSLAEDSPNASFREKVVIEGMRRGSGQAGARIGAFRCDRLSPLARIGERFFRNRDIFQRDGSSISPRHESSGEARGGESRDPHTIFPWKGRPFSLPCPISFDLRIPRTFKVSTRIHARKASKSRSRRRLSAPPASKRKILACVVETGMEVGARSECGRALSAARGEDPVVRCKAEGRWMFFAGFGSTFDTSAREEDAI